MTIVSLVCCVVFNATVCLANYWKDVDGNDLAFVHGKKTEDNRFTEEIADINYDFSKIKNVYAADVGVTSPQVSIHPQDALALKNVIEKDIKKFMKCKVTDRGQAGVILEVTVTEWESVFDHTVPERTVYEAYESYEGWVEEEPSYSEISEWKRRVKKAEEEGRPAPPRPRPRQVWKVSKTQFFGSRRVITADDRGGAAKRIQSNTPFDGSTEVTYPPYDLFSATVIATFNLRDAKTNSLIMSRKGTLTKTSRSTTGQLATYEIICQEFCKDYRDIVKQIKKEVNNLKKK